MKQAVGIRFSEFGQVKICLFECEGMPLALGQGVVADGEHGLSFGRVAWQKLYPEAADFADSATGTADDAAENADAVSAEGVAAATSPEEKDSSSANLASSASGVSGLQDALQAAGELPAFLEKVPYVRRANEQEISCAASNYILSREAYSFCRTCIKERGLDMKLVDVEVLLDKTKVIFYFTAPTRIDFRELVKDLVRQYRTRIELRQIGVRHETQMLGALGNCGMVVCCRRYLTAFAPVTIKMAKEQNLFLNPAKISGICGRLLCCLSFEQENYDTFHRSCPKLGKRYQTTRGYLRVLRSNMFRNSIVVLPEEGSEEELTLEEWAELKPHRSEQAGGAPAPKENNPYDFMVVSASPDTLDSDLASLLEDNAPLHPVEKPRKDTQRPREKGNKRPNFDTEPE